MTYNWMIFSCIFFGYLIFDPSEADKFGDTNWMLAGIFLMCSGIGAELRLIRKKL